MHQKTYLYQWKRIINMMIKEITSSKSQVIVVILLIICIPLALQADRVYKTDGSVLEGNIIQKTEDIVLIEITPSLVNLRIPMEDVERIEEGAGTELSENLKETLDNVNSLLDEEKPFKALDILLGVADGMDAIPSDVLNRISRALQMCMNQAEENASRQETRAEAINQYEKLSDMIGRPGFVDFAAVYSQWANIGDDINGKLQELYYKYAVDLIKNPDPEQYSRIRDYLQRSLDMIQEDEEGYYKILESLGLFEMNYEENYDQAMEYFKKGYENAPRSSLKERFYELMNQARDARIAKAKEKEVVIATPAPITAQDIDRMNPPAPEPIQPPQQAEEEEEPTSGEQFIDLVKNKKYMEALSLAWEKISTSPLLPLFITGLIAALMFWGVPLLFFKWRVKKTDFIASRFYKLLTWTGFLGVGIYIIFLLYRLIVKRDRRERCPFCKKPIDNIESYSDFNFRICPHCHENIVPVYSLEKYIFHLVKTVQNTVGKRQDGDYTVGVLEKDAMMKLIRGIITMAQRKRASDLHIEPEPEGLKIRARIDGMLYEILSLPKEIAVPVVSAIKVMADMDISEKRIPQDGRITIWVDKRDLDLRVNTSPAAQGEKVSIRILDSDAILVDSTKLGLDGDNLEKFERAIRKPYGLILVTGPSGSGKSTSLYVALNTINTGDKNIVTIEDPIEYQLSGISQQQVHAAANFTFATGLRSILRQDPDVIMVGEIRDRETAEIAIDAATTGHLVFTTLHTIDAPTAFSRLTDLGIPLRRYAPILICVIAQRLIRLNCPDCKKPYKPGKPDLERLGIPPDTNIVFMKGVGCETCNDTGFYGRTGLFEILMPDPDMKKFLETDPAVSVIRSLARKKGMKTLREEGLLKISRGLTTVEEVLRVTT